MQAAAAARGSLIKLRRTGSDAQTTGETCENSVVRILRALRVVCCSMRTAVVLEIKLSKRSSLSMKVRQEADNSDAWMPFCPKQ
jgi:hypothetical protein